MSEGITATKVEEQKIETRVPTKLLSRRAIVKKNQLISAQLAATGSRLEEAQRNSMIDSNTELRNRRWLVERIENLLRISQRTGKPFWLLFMDFDDFKAINTRFDHSGGDEVLRLMRKLKTRPDEDIARFGGDEFAEALNDDITMEEAVNVARRNADIVESESRILLPTLRIDKPETDSIDHVTISLGLVQSRPGLNATQLLALGSQTMTKGKDAGKDMIVVQPTEGELIQIKRTAQNYG